MTRPNYNLIRRLPYRVMLKNVIRQQIIKSIMSRPNASQTRQILDDIQASHTGIRHHLRALVSSNILARDTVNDYHFYRINDTGDDGLQELLRELFPDLYDG